MKIIWNKVTFISKIAAVIVYVGTFTLAFYLGIQYGEANAVLNQFSQTKETQNITNAVFACDDNKSINVIFFEDKAELSLSDGRNLILSHAISASGARYANETETIVFWNKGDTAFIQENDSSTYSNCLTSR